VDRLLQELGTSSALDRAELRDALQRLAQSERRYRQLVENADTLIAQFDREGRHLFVNRAVEHATGLQPEQVIGRTNRELGMPAALCELWERKFAEVFTTGAAVEIGFDAQSPSGWRSYRSRLAPERAGDGRIESVVAVVQELTERGAAVSDAGRSAALLQAISDSTGDVIFAKDLQGRLTFANPGTLALIGKPLSAVLGRTDAEFLEDKEAAQRVMANDRRIMAAGVPEELDETVPLPDGTQRVWLSRKVPYRDATGAVIGLLGVSRDITDRKRAEQELRTQRELLGAIIDGIPVMLTIYDARQHAFRFNRALRDVLGWTEADAADGGFMERVYPDPDERQAVTESMRRATPGWRELQPTAKDGTKVPSSWANIRLGEDTYIGIGIDLRERRATAEALRRSTETLRRNEQRYRSFVEASAQIVWTTDSHGQVNFEIPEWQAYTGQTADEARGFGWMNAIHPDDRAQVSEAWAKAFASRGLYEVAYRLRRHDGAWRNILARAAPVTDDAGDVGEYVGTCIDLTERMQAEAARRESEAWLQLTTDALPVLISYIGADRRYRFANAAYDEWFGAKPAIGQHLQEFFPPATYEARRPHIERVLSGEPVVFDSSLVHRTKGRRRTETSYVPDRAEDGRTVRGFVALAYDVTERRQIEEDLKRAKQQAEQASEAKDHFLAVLSHELRTPLTPVLATAQMLENDPMLSAEHRESAQLMRRNVELEARLIDDLLDLTRIARNKLELHVTAVDVHEKILHVLRMCEEEMAAKQLVLTTNLAAAASQVEADPARFQQILWNVLKNAVKFTPTGGTIAVVTRNRPDGALAIEVTDTGVGIDPAALPRIFAAFEQGGREVTRQFGGLGLGLAIAKALVEMHGGTIAAESEGSGRGARFTVVLPARPAPGRQPLRDAVPRGAGLGKAVLLVEDHADTRRVMTRLVTRFGCTVTAAGTLAEARRRAETQPFDLLISDLGLPDGSGTELMQELNARLGLRGIALSGFGMEEDVRRSREAGFEVHLTKPVNLHALEAAVRRMLAPGPAR
jgi:PAS domain S-box-containing protein